MIAIEIGVWKNFIVGRDGAFKTLYDRCVDGLFAFGCHYTSDEELVKDSIHDLFVDLYRYRTQLSHEVNVKAYLFSALRRRILNSVSKTKQQEERIADHPDNGFYAVWDTEMTMIQDEEEAHALACLRNEIRNLPGKQKEVLYLRFTSGLDYEQVAAIMGISPASARTLVYRAIKTLRNKMDRVSVSPLLWMILQRGHEK